jgi:DNA-binding IclR family transcriptional regulator
MARPALSAARMVELLNFLAAHPDDAFTLSDFVRRLGINVASMHAILAVAEGAGYVARDDADRTYRLGPMLVPVGHAALHHHRSIVVAQAELRRLTTELEVTGLVVGATDSEMVILDELRPEHHEPHTASNGQRIRMVPPMGGVFVAWAAKEHVDAWLEAAPAPLSRTESEQITRWLGAIRARGYAVGFETTARHGMRRALRDLQEEPGSRRARTALRKNVLGLADIATVALELDRADDQRVSHIAAPVFDDQERVSLGLYLVGFRRPLSAAQVERLGQRLTAAAAEATRRTRAAHHLARDDDRAARAIDAVW